MSFFKKLFGWTKKEKKNPDAAASSLKTSTQFLKNVNVTAVENTFKPAESSTILIFEDSETWAVIMKKSLEDEGYRVFQYKEADQCVEKVKEHKPDLVLMDINLPGISGLEATKLIKKRAEYRELPILILTSQSGPRDKIEAMKCGARTFLSKDQPLEDLMCAITAYMTNTALKSDVSQIIQVNKMLKKTDS